MSQVPYRLRYAARLYRPKKGTELKNKEFQNFLNSQNIHFFTTENTETKASIVVRFQRTLKVAKEIFLSYMKYVDDVLPKLVHGYNHAYRRSIKGIPASVDDKNEVQISTILYGKKT